MKLDPGFLDHWKTKALVDALGPEGVLAVLRLWGRAQINREWKNLEINQRKLKALCRFPGDPADLWAALTDVDAPWLDSEDDGTFTIHGFEEHQRQVIALWTNGRKGGRPPKEKPTPPLSLPPTPQGSSLVSERKPKANQKVSDAEFIELLKSNPAYEGINIDVELGKMDAWLMIPKNARRKRTHEFIVRWLNKIDRPVEHGGAKNGAHAEGKGWL